MINFSKNKFAELTKQAMGEKTPFAFSRLLQIKPGYLEAILQKNVPNPPKMSILQRIAKESDGRVALRELSAAAGYDTPPEKPAAATLTATMGTWENINGRHVNIAAFQEYLRRIIGTETQLDFARNIGLSKSSVKNWLSSTANYLPSYKSMAALCAVSGDNVDLKDFIASVGLSAFADDLMKPASVTFPDGMVSGKPESGQPSTQKSAARADKKNTKSKRKAVKKMKMVKTKSTIKKEDMMQKPAPTAEQEATAGVTNRDFTELSIIRYLKKQGTKVVLLPSTSDELRFEIDGKMVSYDLVLIDRTNLDINDVYLAYGRAAIGSPDADRMIVIGNKIDAAHQLFSQYPPVALNNAVSILAIRPGGAWMYRLNPEESAGDESQ